MLVIVMVAAGSGISGRSSHSTSTPMEFSARGMMCDEALDASLEDSSKSVTDLLGSPTSSFAVVSGVGGPRKRLENINPGVASGGPILCMLFLVSRSWSICVVVQFLKRSIAYQYQFNNVLWSSK